VRVGAEKLIVRQRPGQAVYRFNPCFSAVLILEGDNAMLDVINGRDGLLNVIIRKKGKIILKKLLFFQKILDRY